MSQDTAPFTHTPRHGHVYAGNLRRVFYHADKGSSRAVIPGVTSACCVVRQRGERLAVISTLWDEGHSMRIALTKDGLQELARCLIDAAADIEREQAQQEGNA